MATINRLNFMQCFDFTKPGSMQRTLRSVLISAASVALTITALAQGEPVQSVPAVDAQKYAGRWFEQARLPNRLQASCVGDVTADHCPLADGALEVINRCPRANAMIDVASGKAVAADVDTSGARLKVSFLPSCHPASLAAVASGRPR